MTTETKTVLTWLRLYGTNESFGGTVTVYRSDLAIALAEIERLTKALAAEEADHEESIRDIAMLRREVNRLTDALHAAVNTPRTPS